MNKYWLIGFSLIVLGGFFNINMVAQTPADSLKRAAVVADSFPVPRKAVLWSLVPGGGQIYNRKYWYIKLPVVYGGFVGGVLFTRFYTQERRFFKEQYVLKLNNQPLSARFPNPSAVTASALLRNERLAYKRLQQGYVFTSLWYVLSGLEAFTAAHLAHFDISDDLSLHIKPSFQPIPLVGESAGLGFLLKF